MAGFSEYGQYDGMGLADLIRRGQVTRAEVLNEAVERIKSINSKLNAIITPMYDLARQTTEKELPGPLAGVPFALKDLLASYAGVPLTSGCRAYKKYIPDFDSEIVVRYKKAGLVTLGKTNTPEFGLLGFTEPELHGITRNPWNLNHTPGGSSGGSAAAVASGMVPLASGGDGGGSIRIPAACCGLFGLKPSRGRTPNGPDKGRVWQGAAQQHVLTRSVRDSAALLDLTQGPETGAPYVIKPPERPYLEEMEIQPGTLKIAFNTISPYDTPVHTQCVKAVEDAARLLEELGHQVVEDRPEIDGRAMAEAYLTMYYGETAADIKAIETTLGRKATRADVEVLTWTLGLVGKSTSAGDFVLAMRQWDLIAAQMGRFFKRYDLYLTPTLGQPPSKIGEWKPKSSELKFLKIINALNLGLIFKLLNLTYKMAEPSFVKTPFTQLANLTGLPAMSVPLYWTPNNLPLGVQFVAPFGEEAVLFRLAAQLEKARPWTDRRPQVYV